MKIIYDFGANNGDDIPYYLLKAERVIAVEANPALTAIIGVRFQREINEGRLVIENCAVSTGASARSVPFYIHRTNHVLSRFLKPASEVEKEFEEICVNSKSVREIISEHGDPFYIKIDVEGYDQRILRDLFDNNIFPTYISAESHDIEVFSILVAFGGYKSFKLVDGHLVSETYKECHIKTLDGSDKIVSFPAHAAGPFGEDVSGEWMTANNFFRYLAFENLGWKDIHASRVDEPNPDATVSLRPYFEQAIKSKLRNLLAMPLRSLS